MTEQTDKKIEIASVAEFVQALSELEVCDKSSTRFFRGHADCCYQLIPSIYRKPHLIKNEHHIIRDAFTYCSDYFLPHETLFEKLVKLQHYGYATRLLDVTSNGLVALYFAVCSSNEKDGEIIILDILNEMVKHDDSDKVAILSALSMQNFDFQTTESNEEKYDEIRSKILRIKTEREISQWLASDDKNVVQALLKNEFDEIVEQLQPDLLKNSKNEIFTIHQIDAFNSQKHIRKLLHDIKRDKPYFLPKIVREDFNNVLCVKTKHNNPRILRQQGSFLIFGIEGEKSNMAKVNDEWKVCAENSITGKRLIIKAEHKEGVLKELETFGISHQTLFPELESQAVHIMDKYRK